MDIRNMDATNGLNNDDWTFLIFLLLMQDLNNKNETWDQFEQDLIYKNSSISMLGIKILRQKHPKG